MNGDVDKLLEQIKDIINKYIDDDVANEEAYPNSEKIKLAIAQLTDWKFDWPDRAIFEDLRRKFPEVTFDNQTHFYKNDRCFKFHTDKTVEKINESYTILISIFGFFSVYRQSYEKTDDGTFILEDIRFIEQNTNSFCDSIYELVLAYFRDLIWLPNKVLIKPVYELNLPNTKYREDLFVVDLLFTHTQ